MSTSEDRIERNGEGAVLVTGGAGFIGSCFVRQMVSSSGREVVVLDKLTYAGNRLSLAAVANHPRLHFYEGDIADRALVDRLLDEHRITAVLNFAAESHVDRSIDAPAAFVMTNVVGCCELLEAARHYWNGLSPERQQQFLFVQVSTDEVYGSLGPEGQFTETSPYQPNSPYSASKAAADHFARAYHHTYGLPVIVTNCSNNYGPYQHPEKLIPLMILRALSGEPLPVYGDGLNVRDWLYVEDHCEALRQVLARGRAGEVYNLGGDCERTNLEVVQAICEMVDQLNPSLPHRPSSRLITFVADRPGHDRRYAIDASKAHRELGWKPRGDFEYWLRHTVQWYMEHSDWVAAVRK